MAQHPIHELLERTPDILFRLDEEGNVLYINPAWESWTGIPSREIEGRPFQDRLPKSEQGAFQAALDELRNGRNARNELGIRLAGERKEPENFRVLMRKREEEGRKLVEGIARFGKDPLNQAVKGNEHPFCTLFSDTEAERMETLEARLAFFPEKDPEPLFECDRYGRVHYMNPTAFQLLRAGGYNDRTALLPDAHDQIVKAVMECEKELRRESEVDGKVYIWLYAPVNELDRVHVRGHDVTAQKRVESDMLDVIVQTQEAERERFSKELHEGIGQYLTAIRMHFEALRSRLKGEELNELDHIGELIEKAVGDVRGISHGLMPRMFKEFGLIATLESMFERAEERTGIRIEMEHDIDEESLDERLEIGVYRVIQDLVEFSSDGKRSEKAFIDLRERERAIHLHFTDQGGREISEAEDPESSLYDLKKFNSRVRALNGQLNLNFDQENAMKVTVRIPIP